jgi:hypothetical protein
VKHWRLAARSVVCVALWVVIVALPVGLLALAVLAIWRLWVEFQASPGTDHWGTAGQWVGALGSFAILVWTVLLVFFRNLLTRPNLIIKPEPDVQRQDPPLSTPPAMWIRFRVTNKGRWRKAAKNCRAFLIGLYKQQGANKFAPMSPEEYFYCIPDLIGRKSLAYNFSRRGEPAERRASWSDGFASVWRNCWTTPRSLRA